MRILLELLISSRDLYKLIKGQDNAIVIDSRPFSEYKNGHVPGAVNIDLFQLHWFNTTKRGIKDFNRQSRLLLSNIGIGKDSKVIFYDNVSGISSARGVWLLLYFSHKNVCMLDGGFEKWKREKLPVEVKSNQLRPIRFKGKPNSKIIADTNEVNRSIGNKNVVIVDARSREEFNGSEVRAARRGHIPSAVNIDWKTNIENSIFKSTERLSKIYPKIPKDAKIITYCQGGYRASNAFLVLKLLGYKNVKMYLGSWGEWGNRLDLPIEIN
ncbi:MAG: sulfurtransferase [Thaumarchaeota archaeon]|nr:MAG: sulfurtransferase [Nitrososphaerota archaeon]TLX90088.1 MAG: sulfurtransferase [Nitrososphaerota archaeon]